MTLTRLYAVAAVTSLLLPGCAVGPDFQRPSPPDVKDYTHEAVRTTVAGEMQQFVRSAEIPSRWWETFQSASLNAVVERALKANPNIDAARSALRVAQENVAAQRGLYWPQIGVSLASTRQKLADIQSSPLNSSVNPFSLHTAQVSIDYAADVFGGNRRQVESLEAQADLQRCELEATRLTIAANVALAAIQEAALRSQMDATQKIIALNDEMLALMRQQRSLGAIPEQAVVTQESSLAQARAALLSFRRQFLQNRDLLIALTGGFPSQEIEEKFDLASIHPPRQLPLSLPSKLVERRPDVRAAEAQAHAASAQIGVAFANMLPQFAISANIGSVAEHFGDLLADSGFWGIVGGITQPIFAGGTLAHRKAAAAAAYDQALAQYRATVITAFQDMADTLHALDQDAAALDAVNAALDAATRSFAIARRQVELGDISHLALLNSEQTYLQAQILLAQARANRYADTVALFQALGGDGGIGLEKEDDGKAHRVMRTTMPSEREEN